MATVLKNCGRTISQNLKTEAAGGHLQRSGETYQATCFTSVFFAT